MNLRRPPRARRVVDRCWRTLARSRQRQQWRSTACFTDQVDEWARLKELILRNAREARTWTALTGVSVLRSPTTTEPLGDATEPTVAALAQGAKATPANDRPFAHGRGQFVLTSLELPVAGHIVQASAEEPFLAFVLKLHPERIAALLLETAPVATLRPGSLEATPAGIAVSEASPALLDAVCRLLAVLG